MAEKECEVWNVVCWTGQGASNVAAGIADDAINNLAKAIMEGMSQMVRRQALLFPPSTAS